MNRRVDTMPREIRKSAKLTDQIAHDQQFVLELLEAEKVLAVQGSGFNWPHPDHLRLVFLPHGDELTEAIGRIERFLDHYRKKNK